MCPQRSWPRRLERLIDTKKVQRRTEGPERVPGVKKRQCQEEYRAAPQGKGRTATHNVGQRCLRRPGLPHRPVTYLRRRWLVRERGPLAERRPKSSIAPQVRRQLHQGPPQHAQKARK